MKFTLSFFAASLPLAWASFKPGCESAPWDSEIDFWNTKYTSSDALPFAPEYNNTFVRIRNRQRREIILHCTNEAPQIEISPDHEPLIVKVPVENVTALDGYSQHLIDMLGMSSSIKRVQEQSTSSCIRGLTRENNTYEIDNWSEAPETEVTFHDDAAASGDNSRVLIYNDGRYAPLHQLGYIKLIGMFFGMEEQADAIYSAIAANYRCAAAQVQDMAMNNDYPSGAFISAYQKEEDSLSLFQNDYWTVLSTDAGSRLVNVSSDGSGDDVNVATDSEIFVKQSWAMIDTTQYRSGQRPIDRVDEAAWEDLSDVPTGIYAVKHDNVWLSDRQTNRNLTHNFFARGPARPDLVLRDLISVVKPDFDESYTKTFLRSPDNPDDFDAQRRKSDTCIASDATISSLGLTECTLPDWAGGYHSSGLSANAYNPAAADDEVASLALSGNGSGLSTGEKAGAAIGAILGAAAIAGAVFAAFWFKKRSARRNAHKQREVEEGKIGDKTSISSIGS
ncbi:hypothetical protein LTR24_010318 [Lithohypha guttulata]|uniref:Uncharacterized protein n=1 Tax=Lithohypha guttulata TaxID=1690604 RepID=A0ABR0JUC6_9EURO|nr:hypothetical protein LTR24_010318 [Lithohypha guttulata]